MRLRLMHRGERKGGLPSSAVIAYAEWRSECGGVWDAYRRWASASAVEKSIAFNAYNAALDREENAARRYARWARRAGYIKETGLADQLARTETGYGGC